MELHSKETEAGRDGRWEMKVADWSDESERARGGCAGNPSADGKQLSATSVKERAAEAQSRAVIQLDERKSEKNGQFIMYEVRRGYAWEFYAAPRKPGDTYLYRFTGGTNGAFKQFIMRDSKNFSVGGAVWSQDTKTAFLFDSRSQVVAVVRPAGECSLAVYRLPRPLDKHKALLEPDTWNLQIADKNRHANVLFTNNRDLTVVGNDSQRALHADKDRKTYRITTASSSELALLVLAMFTARHLVKLMKPSNKAQARLAQARGLYESLTDTFGSYPSLGR